jgi:small multidrug resistance pump
MAYVFLALAISVEVVATSLLGSTHGFSRLWPTVGCLSLYAVSFACVAQAVKTLPVGFTYAVWSGVGTVAIVTIGVVFLGNRLTPAVVVGVALVVAGVVVLNVGGAAH